MNNKDIHGYKYINNSGNIRELCKIINEATEIPEAEIIFRLPSIMQSLTKKEQAVIRRYYLTSDNIFNIYETVGFSSCDEVKECIDSGVNHIIEIIK